MAIYGYGYVREMNMKGALPFLAMVVAQTAQVGVTIASMKAIETGMHNFSYIFYSNALASIILFPAVIFFHRSLNRPTLNLSVIGGFIVLGLLGFLGRLTGYAGNTYASPMVVTAIYNLVPGFTFLLAIVFGYYRARKTRPWRALILKKYPIVLILVLANCSITAILSLLASLILEHDLNTFSLQSKTRLLIILYTGFFGSGFQLVIEGWCIKIKGPLFVAMFQPLGILIAAIMGFIFLGNGLYLGCLIGSAVIVIGFYGVMWGKAREEKINDGECSKTPLLQDNTEEHNVLLP